MEPGGGDSKTLWSRAARDPVVRLTLAVHALLALPYLLPIVSRDELDRLSDYYLELPLIALVMLASFLTSRKTVGIERLFWTLVCTGFGFWLLADLMFALVPGIEEVPFLMLAGDVLYWTLYICVLLALSMAPESNLDRPGAETTRAVGAAGVVLVTFQFLVYFVLVPYDLDPESFLTKIPSFYFFGILNVTVATLAVWRWRGARTASWRATYAAFAIGAALWITVDILDTLYYQQLLPSATGTPFELLWYASHLAFIWATRVRAYEPQAVVLPEPARWELSSIPALLLAGALSGPVVHAVVMAFDDAPGGVAAARRVTVVIGMLALAGLAFFAHRALESHNRRLRTEVAELSLGEARLHEQRLESLGLLAGGLAHDFNNILAGISGRAELATDALPAGHASRSHLEGILAATGHAAKLTNQMLAYAGRRPIERRPLDLNRLVSEAALLLETVRRPVVSIDYLLADDLPPIEADDGQIRQTLVNLITNGLEALSGGPGVVQIETSSVIVGPDSVEGRPDRPSPGRYALVEIRDNGCGVAPEALSQVFDPFYTTKSSGRGLGLAAVRGIVRAHHGALQVHSVVGSGSRFRIFLPAAEAEATSELSGRKLALRTGIERAQAGPALVVDDRPAVLEVAERLLVAAGYRVVTAIDGASALEAAERQGDFSVAVLDLSLPDMSGADLARELKGLMPALPIVLMSGYDQHMIDPTASDGFDAFLNKPFTRARLLEALMRVTGEADETRD